MRPRLIRIAFSVRGQAAFQAGFKAEGHRKLQMSFRKVRRSRDRCACVFFRLFNKFKPVFTLCDQIRVHEACPCGKRKPFGCLRRPRLFCRSREITGRKYGLGCRQIR